MTFRRAADGGVARQKADSVEIQRKYHGVQSRSRQSEGGFYARMPRADHRRVCGIFFKIFHKFVSDPKNTLFLRLSFVDNVFHVVHFFRYFFVESD